MTAYANERPTRIAQASMNQTWAQIAAIGCGFLLVLYAAVRVYQGIAGWKYGLDSTLPEFQIYWMRLLWTQLVLLPIIGVGWLGYLWFTRDRDLEDLPPQVEIVRYFKLLGLLLVYVFAVYWGASYFAEQDGSWHQTVLRDTSFTPSHIAIFYLSFPVYIICGSAALMYATTRLPKFARRISIPFMLAVFGPFFILPNVGLNEWGHAFWFMEEWFTAPLHWGFVALGWTGLALFGLALQIGLRLNELINEIWGEHALDGVAH